MIIKIYQQNSKTGKWYLHRIIYSDVFYVHPEWKSIYSNGCDCHYKKIKFHPLFNVVKVWEDTDWYKVKDK